VASVEQVMPVGAQMPTIATAPTSSTGSATAPQIPASGSVAMPIRGKRRWVPALAVGLMLALAGAVAFLLIP